MNRPAATARRDPANEEKGSICVHFVREALAAHAERNPAAAARLLAEAGIAAELLASATARVSPASFGALWRLLAAEFDDEFLGMDSRPMKAGSFTLLCQAVIHCRNLEQALHRTLRFLRLVLDDIEGRLVSDADGARIVLRERGEAPRAFAAGTLLVIIHGLACWLVGRRIALTGAAFRGPAPACSDEWKVLFSPQVRFGASETSIGFAADCLALPNVRKPRDLQRFLREAPANFLVKYRNSEGAVAEVRRQLKGMAPAAWPVFDRLAQQLHASPATLRRRLDEEGQSYRTIRDELRYDLALDYLGQPVLTIPEIAQRLGFAEPSAFHRAFRKWAGASPGAYRLTLPRAAADSGG